MMAIRHFPAALPAPHWRLTAAAAVLLLLLSGSVDQMAGVLFALAYMLVVWEVALRAISCLIRVRRLNEQFLMVLASVGAIALHDYPEALAILVFYLIGKAFEEHAVQRARRDISALMSLKPDFARVVGADGMTIEKVRPRQVQIGSRIRVLCGDAVPLDGLLLSSSGVLDMAALSGESMPQYLRQGARVPSGAINRGQPLDLEVTAAWSDSQLCRLIELIEDACANRSLPETLITRFAGYYTPVVVATAVLLALSGLVVPGAEAADWLERSLVFLVVSCPCALVLSVPLTFMGGLGALSRLGVMVKGTVHLEQLARIRVLALDKTGTLTRGRFSVTGVYSAPAAAPAERELLETLLALESGSAHPLSAAILSFCQARGVSSAPAAALQEHAGLGLSGWLGGELAIAGSADYVARSAHLQLPEVAHRAGCTIIHTVKGGRYLGWIELSDELRPGAGDFVRALVQLGIRPVMLSGDGARAAVPAAAQLGIAEVHWGLLPADKVQLLLQLQDGGVRVGFMGDGINDAPALARADTGIAMGREGTALAAEAADIVVMHDDLPRVALAIGLARRTFSLALVNIGLVLGVKFLILILGAAGAAGVWLAILGDVGLLVLAVLNAMRTLLWVRNPGVLSRVTAET